MKVDKEAIASARERLGIQLHENEIVAIMSAMHPPMTFLVFGLGNDSAFWAEMNRGGRTVFLEDDKKWFDRVARKNSHLEAYLIDYHTTLAEWKQLLDHAERLTLDMSEEVSATKWDAILVDGPAGFSEETPGRMKSIFAASRLIRAGGDVFIHDAEREVERAYCDRFFSPQDLVSEVEGRGLLRHYRVTERPSV